MVGSGDGKLKKLVGNDIRWNLQTEAQLRGPVVSISVSAKEFIVGTQFGNIYRVLGATLENMLLCESHTSSVSDLAVRPAIDKFATIDFEGFLLVWSHETMAIQNRFMPQ